MKFCYKRLRNSKYKGFHESNASGSKEQKNKKIVPLRPSQSSAMFAARTTDLRRGWISSNVVLGAK